MEVLDDTFIPPADLDPVAMLEEHLAVGWEYDVEVRHRRAARGSVARCLPRALGRLEPVDAGTTRLVGSTSNPLVVRRAARGDPGAVPDRAGVPSSGDRPRLGQRLLAAGDP